MDMKKPEEPKHKKGSLEDLKQRRDDLINRIKLKENRDRTYNKKKEDRTKILVGAAILGFIKNKPNNSKWLLDTLSEFYKSSKKDLDFLIGENKQGSETLLKMIEPKKEHKEEI